MRNAAPLRVQPAIKDGIEPRQVLQQVFGFGYGLSGIEPYRFPAEAQMVAIGLEQRFAKRVKQVLQFVNALAQRPARLLAGPLAPKPFGQRPSQHRSWCGQGQDRKQCPGLAVTRQERPSLSVSNLHSADKGDAQQRVDIPRLHKSRGRQ